MTSRQPSFEALKKSIKEQPNSQEVYQLLKEAPTQSDRASAIVLGTVVESSLEDALLSRLIALSKTDYASLFEGDAPLGNFSSKIKMGFALQIFGTKTRAELNRVREIRNVFAHARKPVSFDTPEIGHICQLMSFHDGVPIAANEKPPPAMDSPKIRFIVNCVQLWSELRAEAKRDKAQLLEPRPHMG